MLIDAPLFKWGILPFLIFLARACDVSMSTVRIILLSKGKRYIASLIGFFEVLIWLLSICQISLNLTNVVCYVAYAGGFSIGTFVGMLIEDRLAIGTQVIRVITKKEVAELINYLKAEGYGVTSMEAQGSTGKVHMIFTIIKRSDLMKVLNIIKRFNPKAFYTIEDVRSVSEGIFPNE